MEKIFSIIAAISSNGVIGNNNDLPWHIPDDLKRFKSLTTGHTIIMGRKTYESLKVKPLPNRRNIVISTNIGFSPLGCELAENIEKAILLADEPEKENFIIGGASIYQAFLPYCKNLYITRLGNIIKGNIFFPEFDLSQWKIVTESEINHYEKFKYRYVNYTRI